MRAKLTEKDKDKIAKRRKDMPPKCRGGYDTAISGKSRKAAIMAFCLECMGWNRKEVKDCDSAQCPLYPYKPYSGKELFK